MTYRAIVVLALASGLFGQTGRLELRSPLGREFHSLPDDKGVVAAAEKALAEHPNDVKLILKLAQAHAAVWEDKEAVAACTRGLKIDPNNVDLLIERGHRELPLRQFTQARDDLKRAADLDPKQSEAYYHLGLAHYFMGEFAPAADAFSKGRDLVTTQDSLVNFTNWCYAALRRAGKSPTRHAVKPRTHGVLLQPRPVLPRSQNRSSDSSSAAHRYRIRAKLRHHRLSARQL